MQKLINFLISICCLVIFGFISVICFWTGYDHWNAGDFGSALAFYVVSFVTGLISLGPIVFFVSGLSGENKK